MVRASEAPCRRNGVINSPALACTNCCCSHVGLHPPSGLSFLFSFARPSTITADGPWHPPQGLKIVTSLSRVGVEAGIRQQWVCVNKSHMAVRCRTSAVPRARLETCVTELDSQHAGFRGALEGLICTDAQDCKPLKPTEDTPSSHQLAHAGCSTLVARPSRPCRRLWPTQPQA